MRLLELARLHIAAILQPGDCVIDGTAGNGHDSLFLAQHIGVEGELYAFDLQEAAIEATRQRLNQAGLGACLRAHCCSHEQIAQHVPSTVRAAMFNLGYLPGGDHRIVTRASSSMRAIESSLGLLVPKGRLTLMVYPAHEGGEEEYRAIEQFLAVLPIRDYIVSRSEAHNGAATAPLLFSIEKSK